MPKAEQKVITSPHLTLLDVFKSDFFDKYEYNNQVRELNTQIARYAAKIGSAGDEWTSIIEIDQPRTGIGPASVKLRARNRDGVVELQFDHHSEVYSSDRDMYDEVTHRTTVLKVRNGVIESIETGIDSRDDYYNHQGTKRYMRPVDFSSFRPETHVVDSLSQRSDALHRMAWGLERVSDRHSTLPGAI